MENIILLLVAGTLHIVCFFVGTKIGQAVSKGTPIELPKINPIEIVRERQNKKEAEMKQDRLDTIIRNMEAYDGTSNGQEDVPRG